MGACMRDRSDGRRLETIDHIPGNDPYNNTVCLSCRRTYQSALWLPGTRYATFGTPMGIILMSFRR
jgi:hypothetical protein